MDWINLHTSFLDSPQFLGAEPTDRATWLCLLRYCVGQENGGKITSALEWGDRKWQQLVRVTLKEVRRTTELWHWINGDLVVVAYPHDKEVEVKAKRTGGHLGGKAATEAKTEAARVNGAKGGRPKTQAETQAETQGKPKVNPTEGEGEGEEKEKEREVAADAALRTGASAAAADDLGILGPDPGQHPAIQIVREKNSADLQAMHGLVLIANREERSAWDAVLREYTWGPVDDACRTIGKETPPGRRILLSRVTAWLSQNYKKNP